MAESNRATPTRGGWFLGLSLVALALVMAIGALLWQAVELTSLARVSEGIEAMKPVAAGIRLLLIGLLAFFWPRLVGLAVRARSADGPSQARWLALRWRVTGWLLVVELVLGQDLLGRFLTAFKGPTA